MGVDTRLASNNSTYHTNTGGTHTSNVRNANTNDKTFKKGTVDLATANSHKVAGGAGGSTGPSRSAAGAAGGLAAGGHGGTGGQVIIHHQAPLPQPDAMTSTELLGAAIGSTIAVILIIIAGAITCRSLYRDQHRSFQKRKDRKAAKKVKDMEDNNQLEESERLTSVPPDVTVSLAQQAAPHRQATEMLHAMTQPSQTFAANSINETGLLKATVPASMPVPCVPPMEHKSARCQRRHVSSNSDSDISPIPHREPRQARAWGPSRNRPRTRDKNRRDTSPVTCFHSSTAARGLTDTGPNLSSTRILRAPVLVPSQSSPTTATAQATRTNVTVTNGCLCRTDTPPAQYFLSEPTPSSKDTGPPRAQPPNGGRETEPQDRDHLQYRHLNKTIDTQQQIISQLLQTQTMMNISHQSTKRSTTGTPATPDNPHKSLHTPDETVMTKTDQDPRLLTSAVMMGPPRTLKTDDDE